MKLQTKGIMWLKNILESLFSIKYKLPVLETLLSLSLPSEFIS